MSQLFHVQAHVDGTHDVCGILHSPHWTLTHSLTWTHTHLNTHSLEHTHLNTLTRTLTWTLSHSNTLKHTLGYTHAKNVNTHWGAMVRSSSLVFQEIYIHLLEQLIGNIICYCSLQTPQRPQARILSNTSFFPAIQSDIMLGLDMACFLVCYYFTLGDWCGLCRFKFIFSVSSFCFVYHDSYWICSNCDL